MPTSIEEDRAMWALHASEVEKYTSDSKCVQTLIAQLTRFTFIKEKEYKQLHGDVEKIQFQIAKKVRFKMW